MLKKKKEEKKLYLKVCEINQVETGEREARKDRNV